MTWQPAVLINLDCALDKMRTRMKKDTKTKTKTVEMFKNALVKEVKDEEED